MRVHQPARRMGLLTAAVALGFSFLVGFAIMTAGTVPASHSFASGSETDDFSWNSTPEDYSGGSAFDDFSWNGLPDDFSWNGAPGDDFSWNSAPGDFSWN